MTPKLRFFLVLVLLVAGFAAIGARPANACTCATFDTRRALAESPGAFVGRLEAPSGGIPAPEDPQDQRIFRFRVEESVKGPFESDDVVDVRSASSPSACGLSASEGNRVGLILRSENDLWFGSLCQQPGPERLLRAAEPLPGPDGAPPAGVIVESTYGEGRAFGLDEQGRLTSYGLGVGTTAAAAICPPAARRADGTFPASRVVELFFMPGEDGVALPGLAVRDAATLAILTEVSLPDYRGALPGTAAVACRQADGADAVVALADPNLGKGRIVRILDRTHRVVWEGGVPVAFAFSPAGETAWLNFGAYGEDLQRVSLERIDGGVARVAAVPVAKLPAGSGPMVSSPDGRHLATVAVGTNQRSQVVLVDLEGATATDPPPIIRRSELSAAGVTGGMVWSSSDRVAFTPRLNRGELVRVFDTKMQPQAAWGDWAAEHSMATPDGRLFGASQGKVWQASLLTGGPTLLREIEDALVFALIDPTPPAAFQSATTQAPSSSSTTTTTTAAPRAVPSTGENSTTTSTTVEATTTTTTLVERDEAEVPGSTATSTAPTGEEAAPVPTSTRRLPRPSSGTGWAAFIAGMIAMGAVFGGVAWQIRVRRLTAGGQPGTDSSEASGQ